ncbi:MAG: DUF4831 family protein [Prevotellaceae bacterium]|jgi:hypothetical protein|nr:DUF4831 family protein [Prevotellaceae bacterium]
MRNVFFILSFVSVLFISASPVFTQKIQQGIPDNSLVYALPQTSIEISVEVVRDRYLPGPYAQYAELYLSIDNVKEREEINYGIGKVSIKQIIEADYDAMYALPAGDNSSFLSLSEQGLIFAMNEPVDVFADFSSSIYKNFQHYPDRLPSQPVSTRKESSFDRIKTDSGFIRVPYQESIITEKDPQSRAEEASKFLFSLRKRRYELITGDVEHAFSGNSMKDALREIKRLEEEYLSLFIGKHLIDRREYKFYITPEKSADKKNYLVSYFSESNGVIAEQTRASLPLMLSVAPTGKAARIEGIKNKIRNTNIYYRVPETASVQLMYGSEELCKGTMHVYQMGKELVIPSDPKMK